MSLDELSLRWEALKKTKPPNPGRKPTDSELKALRDHKQRVIEFLNDVPPELSDSFGNKKMKGDKNKDVKGRNRVKVSAPKPPKIQLTAKQTPVALGWHENETFVFSDVISFLSHVKRSAYEQNQDSTEFGGINRCVFSNLFVDIEPLRISSDSSDSEALGHGAAYPEALCAESYYMAAKSRDPWDARFIVEELKNSFDVAQFGHNCLKLTETQRDRLISFGAPPTDFMLVKGQEEGDGPRWLRGQDGVMPVREGWYEVRHDVFFYILRHKFGPNAPQGSVARSTMDVLVDRARNQNRLPIMVEHRQKDSFWGDGLTGKMGINVLGRILTQIVLERCDMSAVTPIQPWSGISARVGTPNSTLVHYHGVKDE